MKALASKSDPMEESYFKAFVEDAVAQLVQEQRDLLDLEVNEPTLSHHLIVLLQAIVPEGLSADPEYSKRGRNQKLLRFHDGHQQRVRPDIVIHRRGTDDHNLLVLELKKVGKDLTHDRAKLEAFRAQYGYRYTAHVIVGLVNRESYGEVIWVD